MGKGISARVSGQGGVGKGTLEGKLQGQMSRRKWAAVDGQGPMGEGNQQGEWARAKEHEQGAMEKWAGTNEQGVPGKAY